ncbi:MAG: T9SS type A sorting domain-containing protein [Kordia sp.]|uniref:T9SS type A sorting domain-containing protein n=1 Tax=Kordia sp. TaxID=1965332 RepID=UPI003859F749
MKKIILLLTLFTSTLAIAQATTFVPDDGLEGRLQQLGLDSGPLDNLVFTDVVNSLEEFNFSNFIITDLTGLQDFTSLKDLSISSLYGNLTDLSPIENLTLLEQLAISDVEATTFDASALVNLEYVYINDSAITSLDFSNATNLVELSVETTPLTEINLSNNPLLDDFVISNTNISQLNLSSCIALKNLNASNCSSLINLEVSQCSLLEFIEFDDNLLLPYVDLSSNTALVSVRAEDNVALETIFIKNGTNTNIGQTFRVKDNPSLTCVEVDDVAWSNTFWGFATDYFPGFSLNCSPQNDDCSDAVSITLAQPVSGTTQNATNGTNTPSCQENGIVILDVWYEFIAPASGSVTMTINAASLTSKIALYEVCTDTSPLICAEGELLAENLTPNTTYYIQVWLEANTMNRSNTSFNTMNMDGGFILSVQDTSTLSVTNFEDDTNQIRMFPNPAKAQLNISAPTNLEHIAIYDMSGKLILKKDNFSQNSQIIQLQEIASGLYMVQIKTENTTTLKKLIIN